MKYQTSLVDTHWQRMPYALVWTVLPIDLGDDQPRPRLSKRSVDGALRGIEVTYRSGLFHARRTRQLFNVGSEHRRRWRFARTGCQVSAVIEHKHQQVFRLVASHGR